MLAHHAADTAADLAADLDPLADPVTAARGAVTLGLWISATRCVLTYLIAPSLGLLGVALGAAGLVLQVLGLLSAAIGAWRLHRLGSRWWPAYAGLALVVLATTTLALTGPASTGTHA